MAEKYNLIVGSGLSGAVLARRLADIGEKVLVIDRLDHIAGSAFDYKDENGITVHKYGSHIFHTSNPEVWSFVCRFGEFNTYMHKVLALIDGTAAYIPFNLRTIRDLFPETLAVRLESKLLSRFKYNTRISIGDFQDVDDPDLQFLARYIYEKVFVEYTKKQWGSDSVDASVTARVPVIVGTDSRYFRDVYQGIPIQGYTNLIEKMLDAKNIEVSFDYDGIAGAESVSDIYVKDDGHGIAIDHIEEYFGKYGRSQKTYSDKSPGGRIYHGKLGQGRYKSLAAGNFLDWDSVFQDESGTLLHCEIHINSASRMNISYSETADKAEAEHTGTIVHIHGIPDEKIGFITKMAEPMETIPDLLATFAPYLLAYTNITIKYNGVTVDPAQQIKSQEDQELVYEEDGKEPIKARLSAITWKEAQFNKLYICGSSGVVYAEMDYTPLKRTSTSLYLMGDLFEQMHRDNTLAMGNTNPAYAYFEEEAKKFARALVGEQEEEDAAVEIARIKEEGIYP